MYEPESATEFHAMSLPPSLAIANESFPANQASWTLQTISEVVTTILAVVLNGFVLLVFMAHRNLRTSFTIYIISILIFNMLFAVIHGPLNVVQSVHHPVWYLGEAACTIHLYGGWVLSGIIMHGHVLVTFNRIWAFAFPVSYRERHTKQTAKLVCVGTCVYVHIIALPGLILDARYHRLPLDTENCFLNVGAQPAWAMVTMILIFDLPIVIILGSYPFLWYKQKYRLDNIRSAAVERHRIYTFTGVGKPVCQELRIVREGSRSFMVLTVLTISAFIFWTPGQVYYTVLAINSESESTVMDNITSFLWTFQSVFDPLLFILTLRNLRHAAKRALTCQIFSATSATWICFWSASTSTDRRTSDETMPKNRVPSDWVFHLV